jgi:hypothetical protein
VRFGICRQRIPLADISEVHPTHNLLSAPALSLDRLHVQHGHGLFKAVMISPADRNLFLDDLAQKAGLEKTKGAHLFSRGEIRCVPFVFPRPPGASHVRSGVIPCR